MVRPVQINPLNAALSAVVSVFVLVPLLVVGNIIKAFVSLLVKAKYGRSAQLLPGCDVVTSCSNASRTTDALLLSLVTIDGRISKDQIKNRLAARLINAKNSDGSSWAHPKLRSSFRWFMGYKIMVPDDKTFDVDRHFVYVTADDGDGEGKPVTCRSDDDVEDVVEAISNKGGVFPADEDSVLPKWKFHVFYRLAAAPDGDDNEIRKTDDARISDGLDEIGDSDDLASRKVLTCVLLHFDHLLIDGGSMLMVVMPKLFDMDDESNPAALFFNMKPFTNWQRLLMDVKGFLLAPLSLCRAAFPSSHASADLSPLKGRGKAMRGRFVSAPLEMPLVKFTDIRRETDVKINSIVSACLFRALHRFIREDDASRSKKQQQWSWTIMTPYSLWVPGETVELKNQVSAMSYTCLSGEAGHEDPLQGLQLVKETMEEPSRFDYAWSLGCFVNQICNAVPVFFWNLAVTPAVNTLSGVLTNLRGPDEVQTCFGHEVMQGTGFTGLWEPFDLAMMASSYAGRMTVNICGSRKSFTKREEVRKIRNFLADELETLHQAAMGKSKKKSQ